MTSKTKWFIGYAVLMLAMIVAIVYAGTRPYPIPEGVPNIKTIAHRPQIKIMDMRLTTNFNGYDDFMLSYIIDGRNEFTLCQTVDEVNATLSYLKHIGDIYETNGFEQ